VIARALHQSSFDDTNGLREGRFVRRKLLDDTLVDMKKMTFEIGQEIEIIDTNDIYCPAKVVSVSHSSQSGEVESVYIRYLGWEEIWNETVVAKDIQRRFNFGKMTLKKCRMWIKIADNLPAWPGAVYIRSAVPGSNKGIEYLKSESRIYIELYGPKIRKLAAFRDGVWRNSTHLIPSTTNTEMRYTFFILSIL
jgi:hypothetical protein